MSTLVCLLAGLGATGDPARAGQQEPPPPFPLILQEGLVIEPVGQRGRHAFHADAIERQIVLGQWRPPQLGDQVMLPDGRSPQWTTIKANAQGWFEHTALRGGYLAVDVQLQHDAVAILDASGHRLVYINGEIRTGDPYSTGAVRFPVRLRRGHNHLLFLGGRGRIRATLQPPPAPRFIETSDATLPDLIAGETVDGWGAVIVVNATTETARGLHLRVHGHGGAIRGVGAVGAIPPLGTRKVPFRIQGQAPPPGLKELALEISLQGASAAPSADDPRAGVTLRIRKAGESHRRTFISGIDGSVQYYAVLPAGGGDKTPQNKPALVLTLHGAGVEATGQVDAYGRKSWAHLVAPTNRRPFGFDWEDWGRLDAMEVLALASAAYRPDPQRIYLTGHSMGGHGTWSLAAHYPDRFAAIGPSAGWISFWSYSAGPRKDDDTPVGRLLRRAANASDTLALSTNYLHHGVYILHGSADDNVPVEQARRMRAHLQDLHPDLQYHEQPEAGHWWDHSEAPGAGCVDWPAMFDFFASHRIPPRDSVRQVAFATVSPGVSSSCHWLSIEAQQHHLVLSRAALSYDPERRHFEGTTENVALLSVEVPQRESDGTFTLTLDGQRLAGVQPAPPHDRLWLEREAAGWRAIAGPPPPEYKRPSRYGPFKSVFDHGVVLVYGTGGSAAENAWAMAKARYDAETFWYRGNGAMRVLSDREFDAESDPDRSVVLYGNAATNLAWPGLLADCPVQIEPGRVRISGREWQGNDLGALFIRPRRGSARALIGMVGGSGLKGMRLTERLPYFVSGVGYPDCVVFSAEVLRSGAAGVVAAGFFGLDWRVDTGDFAFRMGS